MGVRDGGVGEEIEKLLWFGVADLRVAEELNEDDSDES